MQSDGVAMALAFVVSLVGGSPIIAALRRRKLGQTISEDGPTSHKPKAGTPTMGGLIILLGLTAAIVYKAFAVGIDAQSRAVIWLVASYAALGFVDDYLTVHPVKGVRGISSKPKAAIQIVLAIAFVWTVHAYKPHATLSVAGWTFAAGMLYSVLAVVFVGGMANFVNITDGLDGLVSGLTALLAAVYCLALPYGSPHFLMMALAASTLAFLWYNANPARVFMGDTGSLAIGAAIAGCAVVENQEIFVIVAGLVFVLDGFSTMIQWAVFKFTRITTGSGRRVFKKSPIHHHFELSGWAEPTVVTRFWIMGAIAGAIAVLGVYSGLW